MIKIRIKSNINSIKIYFTILSVLVLYTNCNNTPSTNAILSDTTKLPPPIEIKPILNGEYFSSIEPIVLETNSECQIGEIEKIIILNNRIYIHDYVQKTLFIFDINGKFLNKINKVGKGPGEYRILADFFIDSIKKRIEICDMEKIIRYSYEGKFVNEIKIEVPANNFTKTNNGNYYVWTGNQTDRKTNGTIDLLDNDGKLIKKYFDWDGIGNLVSSSNMFTLNSNFGITLRPFLFDYIIRELNDKTIKEKYIVDFGEYSLNDEYLRNLINNKNLNGRLSPNKTINYRKCALGINDVFETKDYISFNYRIEGDKYLRAYLYSKKKQKSVNTYFLSSKALLPQSIMIFDYADAKTNTFYSTYDVYSFLGYCSSRLNKMKESKEYINFVSLINSITPNSNPIIFKLKINDKIFN